MIALFGSLELRVVCGCICCSLDAFGGPSVHFQFLVCFWWSLCAFGGPRVLLVVLLCFNRALNALGATHLVDSFSC